MVLIILLSVSFLSIYYSIWYLDKGKVSPQKTATTLVCAFMLTNAVLFLGVPHPFWGEWILPIISISFSLWLVFRLNPLHNITVVGCYLACRLVIISLASVIPLEVLNA